jgi:hypothetical protein
MKSVWLKVYGDTEKIALLAIQQTDKFSLNNKKPHTKHSVLVGLMNCALENDTHFNRFLPTVKQIEVQLSFYQYLARGNESINSSITILTVLYL